MYKGITPTFVLTLDTDLTDCDVYVTFKQGCYSLTKSGDDITVETNVVSVFLSQQETLSFKRGNLYVQVNWLFEDKRMCSEIGYVKVKDNLYNGVLS